MPTSEDKAREKIDQALQKAGWRIQDIREVNLTAGRGVALRNFPLVSGHGFADYFLYVDGKACARDSTEGSPGKTCLPSEPVSEIEACGLGT